MCDPLARELMTDSYSFVPAETQKSPALGQVRYIIEQWLLAEYACCYLPMQPNAVVETVSKSVPAAWAALLGLPAPRSIAFTSLSAVESAARRLLTAPRSEEWLDAAMQRAWRKVRGQVE